MIAHHPSTPTLVIEVTLVVLVLLVLGAVAWRERRRRGGPRRGRGAPMRDDV